MSDNNKATSEKSLTRAILSGLAGVGALKLVSLVLATLASIIVARSLGPAGYGQVAFVFAVLEFFILGAPILNELWSVERTPDRAGLLMFAAPIFAYKA